MKYLAIIIGLLIVAPVFGQRKKKDDEPIVIEPTYIEGIPYSLPRTGIRIYVKTVKEDFVPGPYSAYAEQLLGINSVRTSADTKWSVNVLRIESFSEPDPEQVYKALGDAASLVSLSSDGCLLGINSGGSNMQPKQIKANKVIGTADLDDGFSFDYFTDTPFYTPGDSTNGYQPIRVSIEQKAAEAAQKILDCRLNQYDLAAGLYDDFPTDGDAYKVSLNELKQIEKNYLSLFVGRMTSKEDIFSFDYMPEKGNGKGEVLFRISDDNGVVPADDLSGKPFMIEYSLENGLAKKMEEQAKSENPNAGESGIYYRIPGIANFTLLYELNTISTVRISIAQFGVVAPLPEKLIGVEYEVKLHPETGALKAVVRK